MAERFDWINKLPSDDRNSLLTALEEVIVICECYAPIELYDDDVLTGLLDLRDELEIDESEGE